jgi:hypothetical protein
MSRHGGGPVSETLHSAATDHLPPFITAPGETDILMTVMAVVLIGAVLLVGVFYFRLHALPEHIAHRSHKLQLEIVAVLGLLALFTHEHLFWIAGLLLALIDFPDFGGLLGRIARSLEKMAGIKSVDEAPQPSEVPAAAVARTETSAEIEPAHAEAPGLPEESPIAPELRTGSTRG